MATTPEGKVKAKVKALLKKHNIYYCTPATGGYGRSGIPDFICCVNGKFLAIECKAGTNKTTALQNWEIDSIIACGGKAMVINEERIAALDLTLQDLTSSEEDK